MSEQIASHSVEVKSNRGCFATSVYDDGTAQVSISYGGHAGCHIYTKSLGELRSMIDVLENAAQVLERYHAGTLPVVAQSHDTVVADYHSRLAGVPVPTDG